MAGFGVTLEASVLEVLVTLASLSESSVLDPDSSLESEPESSSESEPDSEPDAEPDSEPDAEPECL